MNQLNPTLQSHKTEIQVHLLGEPTDNPALVLHQFPTIAEQNLLIYVSEGSGEFYIDSKKYKITSNTLFVISRYQSYYQGLLSKLCGILIAFDESELLSDKHLESEFNLIYSIRNINVIHKIDNCISRDIYRLFEECNMPWDRATFQIQKNLLQIIGYRTLSRIGGDKCRTIRSEQLTTFELYVEAVEKNYKKYHNVTDYCSMLNTSGKALNRVCQKFRKMTAKQLVSNRVLLEAKNLLTHSSLPISAIANTLGFDEPTNLAKFFKSNVGITPTEFRNLTKPFHHFGQENNMQPDSRGVPPLAG